MKGYKKKILQTFMKNTNYRSKTLACLTEKLFVSGIIADNKELITLIDFANVSVNLLKQMSYVDYLG